MVGALDFRFELLQRDAVKRQLLGIGFDADLVGGTALDIGEADIVDLSEFRLHLRRQCV